MKTAFNFLSILLIMACGGKSAESIKKQIDLKNEEISKIQQQITELETDLANYSDSSGSVEAHLISISEIKSEPFLHFIEVQGSIDGDYNVAVFPEAMGSVEAINVVVGQQVAKGQILAHLNDAAVKEQIKGLKSGLELATTVYEKQKSLWDQNIGSEIQYLQAKNNKETLEAQLASAEKQLDMMAIKSPINGSIEELSIKVGQTASPQFPAFRVVSFGKFKVVTDVAEAYASKISVGDDIIVFLPDINKEYKARVSFASNYINQVNRTFRVEANLVNADANMKANMVAIVKINDYKNDAAVVIPINYVQKDLTGEYVFVAINKGNETVATKSRITTGQVYNGLAEISKGLKAGDKLISTGYFDVEEGEKVRF